MGAIVEDGIVCTQTITKTEIEVYAEISGDRNPIHLGPDAIAHGALLIGKISAAIWRVFGDGTVACELELKMQRPIKADESFNVFVGNPTEVKGARLGEKSSIVRVTKWCGEKEKIVAEGTAVVIPPKIGNGILQHSAILNGGGA